MPRLVLTNGVVRNLERCRKFLAHKTPQAARRASQAIERNLSSLETMPEIGRPSYDLPDMRELVIAFGSSGYVALYRHLPADDAVYVLALRHQKEAGYQVDRDDLSKSHPVR